MRWKLLTFDGLTRWGHIISKCGVIFEINHCTDPQWRALKIIDGLRGRAMEYFDTLMNRYTDTLTQLTRNLSFETYGVADSAVHYIYYVISQSRVY